MLPGSSSIPLRECSKSVYFQILNLEINTNTEKQRRIFECFEVLSKTLGLLHAKEIILNKVAGLQLIY